MPVIYESQESSSPMITRAVASGLLGREFRSYQFSRSERLALGVLGQFPQQISMWLIPRVQGASALDSRTVADLQISDLVNGRLNDYAELDQKYPAVCMGVGMGGATTHLALALNAPFLPQAFVMTLKEGSEDGNVRRYFERSRDLAQHVTRNNPGIMSIQHYDPVHDGWLVLRVNHLRLKLTGMPEEYKKFVLNRIKPGGNVIYLEGGAQWLRYQVGERNVFQVGGWGDISAREFLEGSERIRKYCAREGIEKTDWKLDGYPLVDGPESEWGSEPGFGDEVEAFCKKEGFNFIRICYADPNDFAKLAFKAVCEQFRQNGVLPRGTIVETFSQYTPAAVLQYGLLPLWLIFNTRDSLEFLARSSVSFDRTKPVFLSVLSTFSITPDMVGWQEWQNVLKDYEVINIGARKNHTPADSLALIRWQTWLKKYADQIQIAAMKPFSAEDLLKLANQTEQELQK